MVCHSLLQWTTFCQTSPTWPAHLGWPHRAWLSFIELDKAVALVWLDWLVFCDYGFSVSALLQYLPSYLGFSYLGHRVSLHGCSSNVQPLLLTLDKGYLLRAAPSECWVAPFVPPHLRHEPCVWGYPRWECHDGEVWKNVVHWRREWQTTSVFLPWEPYEQYEKAKVIGYWKRDSPGQ